MLVIDVHMLFSEFQVVVQIQSSAADIRHIWLRFQVHFLLFWQLFIPLLPLVDHGLQRLVLHICVCDFVWCSCFQNANITTTRYFDHWHPWHRRCYQSLHELGVLLFDSLLSPKPKWPVTCCSDPVHWWEVFVLAGTGCFKFLLLFHILSKPPELLFKGWLQNSSFVTAPKYTVPAFKGMLRRKLQGLQENNFVQPPKRWNRKQGCGSFLLDRSHEWYGRRGTCIFGRQTVMGVGGARETDHSFTLSTRVYGCVHQSFVVTAASISPEFDLFKAL